MYVFGHDIERRNRCLSVLTQSFQDVDIMRLYQNTPKLAALNRSDETEANQYRKEYLLTRSKGFMA